MPHKQALDGRCACARVRYRLNGRPLFVHACHCTECQRLSGSAFAINALIEAERVELLGDAPEQVAVTGTSGRPQHIARCPHCRVAVWSTYPGAGPKVRFVRVGTLEEPGRLPLDIHIFTSTKLPWVELPANVPAVEEFYAIEQYWPAESLERRNKLKEA